MAIMRIYVDAVLKRAQETGLAIPPEAMQAIEAFKQAASPFINEIEKYGLDKTNSGGALYARVYDGLLSVIPRLEQGSTGVGETELESDFKYAFEQWESGKSELSPDLLNYYDPIVQNLATLAANVYQTVSPVLQNPAQQTPEQQPPVEQAQQPMAASRRRAMLRK